MQTLDLNPPAFVRIDDGAVDQILIAQREPMCN